LKSQFEDRAHLRESAVVSGGPGIA